MKDSRPTLIGTSNGHTRTMRNFMCRRFVTLDVFTARRFAGNPLAVVLDAEQLETTDMQAIAHEFNHPETVFVFASNWAMPKSSTVHWTGSLLIL